MKDNAKRRGYERKISLSRKCFSGQRKLGSLEPYVNAFLNKMWSFLNARLSQNPARLCRALSPKLALEYINASTVAVGRIVEINHESIPAGGYT